MGILTPRRPASLVAVGMAAAFTATLSGQAPHEADYCRVESNGTAVLADRPARDEAPSTT